MTDSLPPSPLRPPLTPLAIGTTALAVLSSHAFPDTTNQLAFPLTMALIAIFGVPHGAADHLVHAWRHRPLGRAGGDAAFFAGYIALVVAHALLWCWSPPWAFAVFLCLAVWHFGQGEFEYLGGRNPIAHYTGHATRVMAPWLLYVSRGWVVIALLTFAQPHLTFPIIQVVTSLDPAVFPDPIAPTTRTTCRAMVATSLAQHLTLLGYLFTHTHTSMRPRFLYDHTPKLAALVLLFTHVNAYLAFGIYFGLWHALEFFLSVQASLALPTRAMVARAVIPLSLPVLGAMALLGVYWRGGGGGGAVVALGGEVAAWRAFLVVVSSVTTPHVVYLHGYVQVRMRGGGMNEAAVAPTGDKPQAQVAHNNPGTVIKSVVVPSCASPLGQERTPLIASASVVCERAVTAGGQTIR